ncbi:MAG: YkgJ family cysteine cluster protein [Caulobacter sp.]|nr:YkgJ family cysteine cluster protein [Caulobacter sp.]
MKSCGPCTLCCTVLEIPALSKPACQACVHVRAGTGCGIYEARPEPCRTFTCGWLATEALGEAWRPDVAGFLIRDERDQGHLCIDVDPERPAAWRRAPYLTQIRAWSAMVRDQSGCVLVYEGPAVTVVFPEGDIALGPIGPAPRLQIGYQGKGERQRPLVRLLSTTGEVLQQWRDVVP